MYFEAKCSLWKKLMVAGFVCAPPLGIGDMCIHFECRHYSLRAQKSENLANDRIGPRETSVRDGLLCLGEYASLWKRSWPGKLARKCISQVWITSDETPFPSLPENATLGSVYQAFPDKLAPLCEYESLVMRGESDLSVADRELIAAYVSGLNACAYCHGAHIVFAKAYRVEVETIEALTEDRDAAPVREDLKPILAYVEKLTISPSRMTEADAPVNKTLVSALLP